MITVAVDTRSFTTYMSDLEKQQMPYAVALALNRTAEDFQAAERKHLRTFLTIRRATFIDNTIKIQRGNFATKTNLRTIVEIDPTRNELAKFETQTRKGPISGSTVAVPEQAKRGKTDIVVPSQRIKAFALTKTGNRVLGQRRTFMIRPKSGRAEWIILQRTGKGKRSALKVLYVGERSVPIRPELHFRDIAVETMRTRFKVNFDGMLAVALRTARR